MTNTTRNGLEQAREIVERTKVTWSRASSGFQALSDALNAINSALDGLPDNSNLHRNEIINMTVAAVARYVEQQQNIEGGNAALAAAIRNGYWFGVPPAPSAADRKPDGYMFRRLGHPNMGDWPWSTCTPEYAEFIIANGHDNFGTPATARPYWLQPVSDQSPQLDALNAANRLGDVLKARAPEHVHDGINRAMTRLAKLLASA